MADGKQLPISRRYFGKLVMATGVAAAVPGLGHAQSTAYPLNRNMPPYYLRTLVLVDEMTIGVMFQDPLRVNVDVWIDRIPLLEELGLISNAFMGVTTETFVDFRNSLSSSTTMQYLLETDTAEWAPGIIEASMQLQDNGFYSAHCHIPSENKAGVRDFFRSPSDRFFQLWGHRRISEVYTLPGNTFSEDEIASYTAARKLGIMQHNV